MRILNQIMKLENQKETKSKCYCMITFKGAFKDNATEFSPFTDISRTYGFY